MARDETIKLSLIDGVTRTLGQIRDGLSGVGSDLVKLNQAAELASKAFGLVGSAASAIGNAVGGAADLETALASLQAVTRASAEDFNLLKNAAVEASERTSFSAIEATQGLTELARAGYSASDAIKVLNPVLAIAQGEGMALASAADYVTTTMTQFGLAAADAGRVADVLSGAANASQLNVEQLGNSLKYAAPIANQLGLSLEETAAIIGKLADEGFRGESAGVALRSTFTALIDPASNFSKALAKNGIVTRDFTEIIAELAKGGEGAKEALLALDASASPAITALARKGAEGIQDLNAKLMEMRGTATETADIMSATLNGAVDRLQNSVVNLKNKFLEPILQPLAEEAAKVAEQINKLADSPQFAKVREQFATLATDAIESIGQLIADADLAEWSQKTQLFAEQAMQAFDALVIVVKATAATIRGIGAAIDYVAERGAAFDAALGLSADSAKKFGAAAVDAEKPLLHLGAQLDKNKKSARDQSSAMDSAAQSTRAFAAPADTAAAAAESVADGLDKIPAAAKLTEITMEKLAGGAAEAAIGLERLRLATLSAAVATLANQNLQNTDTFRALVAEVGKTERSIASMQAAIDKAKNSQKELGGATDQTAGSLRNFAGAAGQAADAAQRVGSSNSQVSQSFGNIGQQAATAAADMGNMSQELLDLGIQMQSTARNGRDIIDVWEGINRRYEESNTRIQQEIDSLERRNRAVSEEAQIRRQLEQQYGTESTLLEKLVQLRLRDLQQRRQSVEVTRELINVEQQLQAVRAGEFNANAASAASASEQARGGTGGRGTAATPGGRGPAPVVVNINGLPGDRAGWQEAVSRFILPELERINRLSR